MAYPLHPKKARGALIILTVYFTLWTCVVYLSTTLFEQSSLQPKVCSPDTVKRCTQACRKECDTNYAMRPFASSEGNVRVGQNTYREDCEELCHKNKKSLNEISKGLKSSLTQFVLDFYATACCFPEENSLFYRGKQWVIGWVEFLRGF